MSIQYVIGLAVLLGIVGCKKGDDRPPVKFGSCLVEKYLDEDPVRQTCKYQGYTWDCFRDTCERVGEAQGERAATGGAK